MNVITDVVKGNQVFEVDTVVTGIVAGSVVVRSNVELVLSGIIGGNLQVDKGGTAVVTGTVGGMIYNAGSVRITGIVAGKVIEDGGTTVIEKNAIVAGVKKQ